MAVFDLFKRLMNANATGGDRRADERLRATLGARVLVVDDSATIRAVLGKMLLQDGYMVLRAADGETAVEMAQSQFPELIFLDIVLPGISGFAVLRALRRDARTHSTPIVMMSGNQQATEQFYVQRFGADGFVKKPFGRNEVFHAIRSLVQAGRMPARETTPAPPTGIPEGISPEEWAAIPDVAMPDDDHAAPTFEVPGDALPGTIAGALRTVEAMEPPQAVPDTGVARPPGVAPQTTATRGETVITGMAISMAMRPTLASGMRAAPSPRITVNVLRPHESFAEVAGVSAGASPARRRVDGDD